MGCGMFVARDPSVLSAAFHVAANFMPSNLQLDPYVTSVQWSRRFTGLRLFLALAAAGWQGYAAHVERSVALIEHLRAELDALGWRIANHSPLAVLCVEPPAGSADCRSIVARVLDSGRAWVSVATFEGREIVRACVPQGETTPGDVAELADALAEAAQP
jgi:glutamate/tyrosine decarboxylase-like PLP-dependent enzyme